MHVFDHPQLNGWKKAKQKEVLNNAIIKAGYCPSHRLIGNLTIIRANDENILKEEFYLHYRTENEKLLLRTYLAYHLETVVLIFERCGYKDQTFYLSEKESLAMA